MILPSVSIVTPTRDRPRFLARCRKYIQEQTYPRGLLEWVIVDSSERADLTEGNGALFFDEGAPVPLRLVHAIGSLGHLHNTGNRNASGKIIVHFDDDDWHAPTRIEKQVTALRMPGVRLVCTDDFYVHFGPGRACKSWGWGIDLFCAGGTFAYWRSVWERNPFPSIHQGEDQVFGKMARIAGGARNLRDPTLFAYIRHGANTCELRDELAARANADDYGALSKLLGPAISFYDGPTAGDRS